MTHKLTAAKVDKPATIPQRSAAASRNEMHTDVEGENSPTRPIDIVTGGITLRSQPQGPHGSSVACEDDYRRRRYNVVRGVTDLLQISRMILRRMDIEVAERGEDHPFVNGGHREELRQILRNCEGKDRTHVFAEDHPAHQEAIGSAEHERAAIAKHGGAANV